MIVNKNYDELMKENYKNQPLGDGPTAIESLSLAFVLELLIFFSEPR